MFSFRSHSHNRAIYHESITYNPQGSAQDFLRGGRAEPACPFRCLQTVVVLTVCMDKLDCHVIK